MCLPLLVTPMADQILAINAGTMCTSKLKCGPPGGEDLTLLSQNSRMKLLVTTPAAAS
jgi:hypothetical protein